jgi:thiosulfate/3-mercaptopyruvate sulfurtransferase
MRTMRIPLVGAVTLMLLGGLPTLAQEESAPAGVEIPAVYAHPEVLVDANWVAAHMDDPTVRIVDARMPLEGSVYEIGHIPGAVFVDMLNDLCCPSDIMDADRFAALMGRLGIGDDTTVVIYDTEGGPWAARLWWALRYYGHDQAAMLDGGLRSWVLAGKPLDTLAPWVLPAVFTPEVQPSWRATTDEVRAAIDDPAVSLVDALPWPNYTGDAPDFGAGHIPSAVSLPATDTLDAVMLTVRDAGALSRMLMRAGLDPRQRVITYCGGGYAGAHDAFVLHLMGFEDVALYDGAMGEWSSDPDNPVEVVP